MLLDRAEQLGAVGSWEWTPETGELVWSDNLFRILGLAPRAAPPSVEFMLARSHPSDVPRLKQTLRTLAAGEVTDSVDYRIVRDDDVVRHLRSKIALVDESGGARRLIGTIQDVTEQDSIAHKLAAHAAVSKALDRWQEFEAGARDLLAEMASAMNLPFGALWIPRRTTLESRLAWHVDSAALRRVAAATRAWRPGRGSPALGRAWQGRQPVVSNEPTASGPPQRTAAMLEAGVRSTIVVPAVARTETLAVMEFLSCDPIEPSEPLLRTLHGIGHEVGYFLGQRRGELAEPVLRPRELEVLQLAARDLAATDIARELGISRATVKRHFEGAYARLGVSGRVAAVAQAMRQGLIS
jgi:DNA-binding CsgD family transcriptional regulator